MDALIIDDEKDICYLLSNMLKQKKINAINVNNLADATGILKIKKLELIFLDNNLPDGKGINFIGYIRKMCPASKIIMITAQDNAEMRNSAFKEGADHFVGKPLSPEVVYEIIDAIKPPQLN